MKKFYIFMAAVICGLASCSTDEVETFDEHNYLSFEKSTLAYTFAFSGSDVTSADFELPVVFAGRFSQTDRQFSIVPVAEKSTAKEGTDFQLLAANEQTIKAGMSSGRGKIRLMRTPALKEDDLKLVLAIAANENFLPGVTDTLTVTISDRIMQPDWWDWTYNSYWAATQRQNLFCGWSLWVLVTAATRLTLTSISCGLTEAQVTSSTKNTASRPQSQRLASSDSGSSRQRATQWIPTITCQYHRCWEPTTNLKSRIKT